jgi:hypothetical protein
LIVSIGMNCASVSNPTMANGISNFFIFKTVSDFWARG